MALVSSLSSNAVGSLTLHRSIQVGWVRPGNLFPECRSALVMQSSGKIMASKLSIVYCSSGGTRLISNRGTRWTVLGQRSDAFQNVQEIRSPGLLRRSQCCRLEMSRTEHSQLKPRRRTQSLGGNGEDTLSALFGHTMLRKPSKRDLHVACSKTRSGARAEDSSIGSKNEEVVDGDDGQWKQSLHSTVETTVRFAKSILPLAVVVGGISLLAGGEPAVESGKKKSKKAKSRTMPLEVRSEWTKDLPLVKERIPYTDIMELSSAGRLKHLLFHPNTQPRARPETILVVLDDDRVVRTVLPAWERDARFWQEWQERKLAESVVEVYTPAPPDPEPQAWGMWGPSLTWVYGIQTKLEAMKEESAWRAAERERERQEQRKPRTAEERQRAAARARLEQLEREKKERLKGRKQREEALKRERAERARLERLEVARARQEEMVERESEAREKREERRLAKEASKKQELVASFEVEGPAMTRGLTVSQQSNTTVSYALGVFFFILFYQVVVLGVKKQRQDYDDRQKIRDMEEEERRKIAEYEKEAEAEELASKAEEWATEGMSEEEKEKARAEKENAALATGLKFMKSGAKVRRAKGKRPPQYMDMDADVKFTDVAGLGDIRRELEEIVDFFRFGERYRRRGSKIPGGILLSGAPGTGKTLLAKAVAGEAGVNFFSISASQFVEIYVGVGASRVRALYNEARENAPAVVFIDELDAVGRQRGLSEGSGSKERDATLNQLLTCLDGFEGRGEVITIAATNRPDILDPALVRPGRFDRKIFIPKPSNFGRAEILKVHARSKPMADDVDYFQVADMARGMVGAQLANLLDIAALSVLRSGRDEITTEDLLEAVRLEETGFKDERDRTDMQLRKLALNEAASAAVAANFPQFSNIQLISISPRMGEEKGSTRIRMEPSQFMIQSPGKRMAKEYITMQLAGRAADEIWNGPENMSTIWADSIDNARKMARDMIWTGLSDDPNMYGLPECWTEPWHMKKLDEEAEKIINDCYEHAKELLRRNRRLVIAIVDKLMEERALSKEEYKNLVERYGDLDPMPKSIAAIREENVRVFMESMIADKRTSREAASVQ